jgi:hypothetical protein
MVAKALFLADGGDRRALVAGYGMVLLVNGTAIATSLSAP